VIKLRSSANAAAKKIEQTEVPKSLVAAPGDISFETIASDPVTPVPETLKAPKVAEKPTLARRTQPVQQNVKRPSTPRVAQVQPNSYVSRSSTPSAPSASTTSRSTSAVPAHSTANHSVSRSAPAITAEIVAPKFINVNEVAKMTINVRNAGSSEIRNVRLLTTLPEHARFESSVPRPSDSSGQRFEYLIPTIGPNQTRQVTVDLVPTRKLALEIGTDIVVENRHSIAVGVREPVLQVHVSGPGQVSVGDLVEHEIVIENAGDGVADSVRLEAELPSSLRFTEQKGMEVAKNLAPGKTQRVIVKSIAQKAGMADLSFLAIAGSVKSELTPSTLKIVEPKLSVSLAGPRMNFVERDGIYSIRLENAGEATVSNVQVKLAIPAGMKITTINRPAASNDQEQTLTWTFDQITEASTELIQLKAIATKAGQQICRVNVSSNENQSKQFELATNVVTRAEMNMHVRNQTGPVQVGEKAEFSIAIENTGSRDADNVTVRVELPDTMMPVKQDGVTVDEFNRSFLFNKPSLAPGQRHEFKFSAVGAAGGEFVVRSVMENDSSQPNIIAEDTVFVYEVDEFRVSEALGPNFNR
jgi:uncharacterized repeat protein (TIGR01451 family)